jgi:superfamily II DNA/RNA helicase
MLVINFDIPYKKENYIHRIGRSGRFGKRGVIINIVTTENLKTLLEISNFYNIKIDILPNLSSIF